MAPSRQVICWLVTSAHVVDGARKDLCITMNPLASITKHLQRELQHVQWFRSELVQLRAYRFNVLSWKYLIETFLDIFWNSLGVWLVHLDGHINDIIAAGKAKSMNFHNSYDSLRWHCSMWHNIDINFTSRTSQATFVWLHHWQPVTRQQSCTEYSSTWVNVCLTVRLSRYWAYILHWSGLFLPRVHFKTAEELSRTSRVTH
jgi:hypothetical protein